MSFHVGNLRKRERERERERLEGVRESGRVREERERERWNIKRKF